MKLKTKILMAVLGVFFLFTGNVFAASIDVSYTVSGNDLNFSITNNVPGYDIFMLGLEYSGIVLETPVGMFNLYQVYTDPTNGITYNKFNIPVPYLGTDETMSGLKVRVTGDVPVDGTIDYYVKGFDANGAYQKFYGQAYDPPAVVSAVPEPATLLMLGLGLFGMAGLTRKIKK